MCASRLVHDHHLYARFCSAVDEVIAVADCVAKPVDLIEAIEESDRMQQLAQRCREVRVYIDEQRRNHVI